MRHVLTLHPDSRCDAVHGIDVVTARPRAGIFRVRYSVQGEIGAVKLPPMAAPERTDGLWRHTCFEAFLRTRDGHAYYEINLSPSSQWAVYRFDAYREGMRVSGTVDAPQVSNSYPSGAYDFEACLDLRSDPDLNPAAPWQIGLSAVIEETNGRISYWALKHPPGKPDFHHSDCFAALLPGPLQT